MLQMGKCIYVIWWIQKKKQAPRLGTKPYGNKLASFRYNIVERAGKVKNEHS